MSLSDRQTRTHLMRLFERHGFYPRGDLGQNFLIDINLVEFVAESIGLSAKKLRRLLASEGTTFSDLLETVRSKMARELVANSNTPVASIAGLLDYSATPPFILAFRRWTGMSPLEYRKAKKNGDPI